MVDIYRELTLNTLDENEIKKLIQSNLNDFNILSDKALTNIFIKYQNFPKQEIELIKFLNTVKKVKLFLDVKAIKENDIDKIMFYSSFNDFFLYLLDDKDITTFLEYKCSEIECFDAKLDRTLSISPSILSTTKYFEISLIRNIAFVNSKSSKSYKKKTNLDIFQSMQ